jgi:hypothetical protein
MWKCNECGFVFEDTGIVRDYIDGQVVTEYGVCTLCHSDDIDELKKCDMCRETYITSEKDRCPTCEERTALWLEEAIGNIQSDTGAERSEVIRAMVDWIERL